MSIDLALASSTAVGTLSERDAEELLKQVAERLVGIARATDTLARIDDGKFAMILEELTHPEDAERVKRKAEAALAGPVMLWERAVRAPAAVSLQFYPSSRPEGEKPH
jgi:GGDEF domain-containing protein